MVKRKITGNLLYAQKRRHDDHKINMVFPDEINVAYNVGAY